MDLLLYMVHYYQLIHSIIADNCHLIHNWMMMIMMIHNWMMMMKKHFLFLSFHHYYYYYYYYNDHLSQLNISHIPSKMQQYLHILLEIVLLNLVNAFQKINFQIFHYKVVDK